MKRHIWSKLVCLSLLSISLCACGESEDVSLVPESSSPSPVATETVQTDVSSERNKVYMENNEMYGSGRKESVYDTLYVSYNGLEVWGEGELNVDYKEGTLIRKLLFKNTSAQLFVVNIDDVMWEDFSGEFQTYMDGYKLLNHPNGGEFYIDPGQEYLAELDYSPATGAVPEGTQVIGGELTFDVTLRIHEGNEESAHTETFQMTQNYNRVLDYDLLREQKSDGVLRGTVTDESGNPIEGASVSLIHPGAISAGPIKTDAHGNYSFSTGGFVTQYAGNWREASLVVEAAGYDKRVILAYPKDGEEVVISPTLYEKSDPLYYEQIAVVDLGLQGYEYDTDNSSIIAFVPFHTERPSSEVKDRIRLTVTDFDGNILFTHKLPEEVPYVDVSEDGQYVISFEDYSSKDGFRAIIFDNTGNEVYSVTASELPEVDNIRQRIDQHTITRCAQLSNDNKYLVLSDVEGRVWFIDWQENEIIWSDFLDNQVRNIKFSPDNENLYLSSGDGYIYGYDISGKQLWKQYVQSWAPKMIVTEHYVINSTKSQSDGLVVTDRITGERKWSYPTQQGALDINVSPDESMIWFGNSSSSSYSVLTSTVFDMETGKVLYQLNGNSATKAEFTKDGSKIISADSTSVYVNDAKTGALLWTQKVIDDYDMSMSLSLAANEDGSKFAVAMNNDQTEGYYGQAYFFALTDGNQASASQGDSNQASGQNEDTSSNGSGVASGSITEEDVDQILKNGGTIHVIMDGEIVLNGKLDKDVRIELDRRNLIISGNLEVADGSGCLTISDGSEVDLRGLTINNSITNEGEYAFIKTENCHTLWPVDGAIKHDKPVKGMLILIEDGDHKEFVFTR